MKSVFIVLIMTMVIGFQLSCCQKPPPAPCGLIALQPYLPVKISPSGLTNEQLDALDRAVSIWNETRARDLFVVAPDGTSLYVLSPWNRSPNEQATTTIKWQGAWTFWGEIKLNPNFKWFYGDVPDYSAVSFESLLIHELGHILGVLHVENTVMDPKLSHGEIRLRIEQSIIDKVHCGYGNGVPK